MYLYVLSSTIKYGAAKLRNCELRQSGYRAQRSGKAESECQKELAWVPILEM
jgi:hypothetical protein